MRSNHLKSESIIPIFCLAKLEFLDSHYHLLTEKSYITSSLGNTSLNGFSSPVGCISQSWGRVIPVYTAGCTAVHTEGLTSAFAMQSRPGEGGASPQDKGPIVGRVLG